MSLDGLRAWIGEVERKLGMRTRVFIVLVAIAVGGAGAAVYLALDAQDNAVSKDDLQAVREELVGSPAVSGGAEGVAQLEAEVESLQAEVATLRGEESAPNEGASEGSAGSTGGVTPGSVSGGAGVPQSQQKLREAVEKAEEEAKK
jgi:hypothetical protein